MTSIRDRWPALTARERDAEVAKAKGQEVQWITGKAERRPNRAVPHYSTSWADAGPLLEELREMDDTYIVLSATGGGWRVECRDYQAESTSAPEAIAFAYCLAKERE